MRGWGKVVYNHFDYEVYCKIKEYINHWVDVRLHAWEIQQRIIDKRLGANQSDHFAKRELMEKLANDIKTEGLWTGEDADSFCNKVEELVKRSKDADDYLREQLAFIITRAGEYEQHYRDQLKRCEEEMGFLSQAQLWVDENIF